MSETYDCIVVGVGGFGSAVLHHVARRGVRVLGLERFDVPHEQGSSHGETRVIRKAYFEHPDYVPLLLRAYDLWRELESAAGRRLYHDCGLLIAGHPDDEAIPGARLAAKQHGITIEEPTLAEARARFPGFGIRDDFEVVFEPDAGFLEVENCVTSHVDQARAAGAVVHTGETVLSWESDGQRVRVRTDRGEYEAARLIITAGAWAGDLLNDLGVPLRVTRKLLFWHETTTGDYDLANGGPAYYFDLPSGDFYGFPSIDGKTVKVAQHTDGDDVADPLTIDREMHPADVAPVSAFLAECLPKANPNPLRHAVCMYTMTPDSHFLVDRHPEYDNVAFGAGFSGHGFKFTSAIGEALADLALDDRTDLPISFLSLDRLR
jgi:sarcosine oxidase